VFDTIYCIDWFIEQVTVVYVLGYDVKSADNIDKSVCELMCYISSYF
jgi:hypothetical protein